MEQTLLTQIASDVGEMKGEFKQFVIAANRRFDEGVKKDEEQQEEIDSLKRTRTYYMGWSAGAVFIVSSLIFILTKVLH